jgi:predicted transposase YbfD/YdcC
MKETPIHQYFDNLTDPRIERTKKHPLINIIFIALCAVICGAEDWVSMERFGKVHKKWLGQFLDLKEGTPSHDTFQRVFSILDNRLFTRQFIVWAESLAEKVKKIVSIDGKSMRGTKSRTNNLGPLHMVNVWCCENQLVLGQEIVDGKSNEITAIPRLLELLELEGAIITLDAMGTQKDISKNIIDKGADYVLALKGNQGNLHSDVQLYFETLLAGKLSDKYHYHHTLEKDHGRIEEREYWTAELPDNLHSDDWCELNSITKICAKRTIGEETSIEDRYYITSIKADSHEIIADAIRKHWQVENCLHWRLDVSFNEDRWKSKEGNAAMNMGLLNKIALNLLKKEQTSKVGVKNRRLMAAWDINYLAKVLTVYKI